MNGVNLAKERRKFLDEYKALLCKALGLKQPTVRGQTIAQFLTPDRYDRSIGQYHLSEKPVEVGDRRQTKYCPCAGL